MIIAGGLSKRQMKTRNIFMDATAQLILENGYSNITVTSIAERADYGRWAFYQYFENKEDVVYQVVTSWLGDLMTSTTNSVQHLKTPAREYVAWQTFFRIIHQNRDFFYKLGTISHGEFGQKIKEFAIEDFRKRLENGEYGLGKGIDPKLVSRMHVGAIMEITVHWILNPEWVDIDQITDDFFRFMFSQEPPQIDN